MGKLPKYSPCQWCSRQEIEKHHVSQHNIRCFMSPKNLKLIANYFTESILNPSLLKRKSFHKYCVDNKILSPVSMGEYFNHKKIKALIVQLLITLHNKNLFDWECAEIIIYHITNGSFFLDKLFLTKLKKQTRIVRGLNSIDTHDNYQNLIQFTIKRAKLDLQLTVGNKNENNEVITRDFILSALEFLQLCEPDFIKNYTLGTDAIEIFNETPKLCF